MKTVFTATGSRVVKRNLQIVLAEKPAEGATCFLKPPLLVSYLVCQQTRRDGRAGLDRLLIEASLLVAFSEALPGAYRNEDVCIAAVLLGDQPFERLAPNFDHPV